VHLHSLLRRKTPNVIAEINTSILSGRIDDATELLNEHFPAVLSTKSRQNEGRATVRQESRTGIGRDSRQDTVFCTTRKDYTAPHSLDPAHLSLNLRIQAFIELCRTIPLPYKAPHGRKNWVSTGLPDTSEDPRQQASGEDIRDDMVLLSKAQKLYALVSMLPNPSDHEQYYQELKDVAGLLAYKVPETSSSNKFLSQKRREAVAEQIDSAILYASGRPVISTLELIVRHVTTVWAHAHELGVTPQPGASVPPSTASRGKGGNDPEPVPPFDIGLFLEDKHSKESST